MKNNLFFALVFLFVLLFSQAGCNRDHPDGDLSWTLGPFVKADTANPVLGPVDSSLFVCPVRNAPVKWEAKDVFNPAAVVRNGKIHLLYRAEDSIGKLKGTSRIGMAVSKDGFVFKRFPQPVLYPEKDRYLEYEWEGGCEDPRIVEDENGMYHMTYTAWNGDKPRLFIATSKDLFHWTKYGSVFQRAYHGKYFRVASKSGAIVCRPENDRLVAAKIRGKYWMYFGDTDIFLAWSDDLIHWTPVEKSKEDIAKITRNPDGKAELLPVLQPRKGKFDSRLVESGPPALITKQGILLIYNSKNSAEFGDSTLPDGTYAAGQALFDKHDPGKLLHRTDTWFIKPDRPYEITGQVNNVCFVEGLARFQGKWFLYYGTADSKIAVAVSSREQKIFSSL